MKRWLWAGAAILAVSCGTAPREETITELRERVFSLARSQVEYMDSLLTAKMPGQAGHDGSPARSAMAGNSARSVMAGSDRPSPEWRCPRTFQGDSLVTSDIGWWCSGFYPGVLWTVYAETGDEAVRDLAVKHTLPLSRLLEQDTDHDIGFQLMSSFGKMALYRPSEKGLSPDSVLRRGAVKLEERFVPGAGVLRSWNFGPWKNPVIIDNMMNLELLMAYGHPEIAEKHALTTAANHFREDGTTWHLVDYADKGTVLGKQTVQGYADDSAWARGQAWALYGYAMMALREKASGNEALAKTFYEVAHKLESWLYSRLPEDGIPYWDFSQTDLRDASAGAIIACGLLKLRQFRGAEDDGLALSTAERILRTLASPEYLAEPETNGGFLLKHSVGNRPAGSEVDVPLTYADYYFLEALRLIR